MIVLDVVIFEFNLSAGWHLWQCATHLNIQVELVVGVQVAHVLHDFQAIAAVAEVESCGVVQAATGDLSNSRDART